MTLRSLLSSTCGLMLLLVYLSVAGCAIAASDRADLGADWFAAGTVAILEERLPQVLSSEARLAVLSVRQRPVAFPEDKPIRIRLLPGACLELDLAAMPAAAPRDEFDADVCAELLESGIVESKDVRLIDGEIEIDGLGSHLWELRFAPVIESGGILVVQLAELRDGHWREITFYRLEQSSAGVRVVGSHVPYYF